MIDPVTGLEGDPDEQIMQQVEKVLHRRLTKNLRILGSQLISQIGAFVWSILIKVDYERLFGSYHHRLKEDCYDQKKSQTTRFQRDFL